ncbi:hypothetical protein [Halomonas stenophila]|uniref:PNPLA domain-containing protein n=1 Tax=Halomonas stenophila TaxID=795312 RepID=A0A7W5HN26_9GAMM|nr:hypothetical protein [Halomonas stenophila]MBB3233109.1 hypothetical protein [Halomonas stenophila]
MSVSGQDDIKGKGGGDLAVRFEDGVRPAELAAIHEGRRLRRDGDAEANDTESIQAAGEGDDSRLSALAFSGGGIRSATFNLGVTQGLARLGLLRGFDYLSVNSGGSYIGSWLLAWIRRDGIREVEHQLRNDACRQDDRGTATGTSASADNPEAGPVSYLRRFTNYLTPRVGAFSADTWTMATTYLRNLLLNQVILVLALGAMLVAPRILVLAASEFNELGTSALTCLYWGIGFLVVAIVLTACNQLEVMIPRRGDQPPWYAGQSGVLAGVVLPVFAAAWFVSFWMWFSRAADKFFLHDWLAGRWTWYSLSEFHQDQFEPLAWALLAGVVYLLIWIVGVFLLTLFVHRRKGAPVAVAGKTRMLRAVLLTAPAAGAVGGFFLWAVASLSLVLEKALNSAGYDDHPIWHLLHVTVWGAPAITAVFILTAGFHIGLMGRGFPEALRQWWSRLGAWLLIWTVTWLGIFGIALYGPVLLVIFGTVVCTALGGGWIFSTIGGVLVGRNTGNGEAVPPVWRRAVIAAAPHVFIVGMLASIALGAHALLDPPEEYLSKDCQDFWIEEPSAAGGDNPVEQSGAEAVFGIENARHILKCHTERLYLGTTRKFASEGQGEADGNFLVVPLICFLLAIATLLFSWRVDINEFSMHLFYRNRLVRAFLGASNRKRKAQPFTGFDPADDLAMPTLSPFVRQDGRYYDGPFPLLAIALNLVSGRDLAWQERKAASFVFTPLFSGFSVQDDGEDAGAHLQTAGYRPTGGYRTIPEGGISLGTAMAISGAAASPNMGAGTTPAMAFLLTVFNVRLGWWLGNPRHDKTWNRMGPKLGIAELLSELFGNTNDRSRYVYLSDGGHFDNLGLYELIRRRCRFIVVSDGGADPNTTFEDLGNAIRKCCADFGVGFELDPEQIRRDPEIGLSRWHCAVGKILYDRVDGGPPGVLVYIKASLTGDEPVDVQAYAAAHPQFPHEPTSDQWFSESQFESYRKLGEHVALSVFGAVDELPASLSREELYVRLSQTWFPPSRAPQGAFTLLSRRLDELMKRLRTDPALAFLVPQIYPEWLELASVVEDAPPRRMWLPETHDELVAGFFFCHSLIQLMEECYLDLDLEAEYDYPDNRGWLNLFKHWSWAGMVRATWAVTASSFGARFQTFCCRRLDLEVGEVQIEREDLPVAGSSVEPGNLDKLLDRLASDNRLNFLERSLTRILVQAKPDIDCLLILRLCVQHPHVEAMGVERDSSEELDFTFGFVLARGDELVYLRVQDHLRKIGLARRAMRRIVRDEGISRVAAVSRETLPDWCRETPGEDRLDALPNLLRSAREHKI